MRSRIFGLLQPSQHGQRVGAAEVEGSLGVADRLNAILPDASPAGVDFRQLVVDEAVGATRVCGALKEVCGFDEVRRCIGVEADAFI